MRALDATCLIHVGGSDGLPFRMLRPYIAAVLARPNITLQKETVTTNLSYAGIKRRGKEVNYDLEHTRISTSVRFKDSG